MIDLKTDWTYEMLLSEAKKYTSRGEFSSNSNAYQIAAKRCFLDEICSHMEVLHVNWSDEMIFEVAAKFKSRSDFKESSLLAYEAARRKNILDKACDHMEFKI